MNMAHLCHEYKRGCILKATFLTTSLGGWSDLFISMSPVKALVSSSKTKPWLVKMTLVGWLLPFIVPASPLVAPPICFRWACFQASPFKPADWPAPWRIQLAFTPFPAWLLFSSLFPGPGAFLPPGASCFDALLFPPDTLAARAPVPYCLFSLWRPPAGPTLTDRQPVWSEASIPITSWLHPYPGVRLAPPLPLLR